MASGYNPTVPDFLQIAMQAQQQRRQAEQDRLQQLQIMQQQQDSILNQTADLIDEKTDLSKLRAIFPNANAGTMSMWELLQDKKKQAAKAKANEPIEKTLAGSIPALVNTVGQQGPGGTPYGAPDIRTALEAIALAQGLDPQPLLSQFDVNYQLDPIMDAETARNKAAEAAQAGAIEQKKSDVRVSEHQKKKATDERFENRKLAVDNLVFAAANGDQEAANSPILASVPYGRERVAAERARTRIQDLPLVDAEEELRDLGVPIEVTPKSKIRGYAAQDKDGKYVEPRVFKSAQTNLLLNGSPTSTVRRSFEAAEATATQLNTMEALIQVIRSSRTKNGKMDTTRLGAIRQWVDTKVRNGYAAGDLSMLEALRSISATPFARNVGQEKGASTEQDVARQLESLPNLLETLAKEPDVALGRLEGVRRGLYAQLGAKYNSEYKREVWVPRVKEARLVETARAKVEIGQMFGAPVQLSPEEVSALQKAGQ